MSNDWMVKVVKYMEIAIAIISMIAIGVSTVVCVCQAVGAFVDGFFQLNEFMENILTLVVGIEFVRMLILHTPQSVIEVLLYAVARQIVITHDSSLDNLIGVTAIAVIFMIQKYLLNNEKQKDNGGV